MKIEPLEVESIDTIGDLNGEPVKIIKTVGGYLCAVGRKSKNKKTVEPIAAGSHIALITHQIEKQYKNDFRPSLNKSESQINKEIKEYTNKLSKEMIDKGFELFCVSKNEKINLIATKYGAEVFNLKGNKTTNGLEDLKKHSSNLEKFDKEEINEICRVLTNIINKINE